MQSPQPARFLVIDLRPTFSCFPQGLDADSVRPPLPVRDRPLRPPRLSAARPQRDSAGPESNPQAPPRPPARPHDRSSPSSPPRTAVAPTARPTCGRPQDRCRTHVPPAPCLLRFQDPPAAPIIDPLRPHAQEPPASPAPLLQWPHKAKFDSTKVIPSK